jgi:hypothetical protein
MLGLNDVAFLGSFSAGGAYDPDAQAYITAVETADGQALEPAVRTAINDFVVGCKVDGIWNALKASCIMAGARKKEGSFIDLKTGTQILTNNGFLDADYNRKTGLRGNKSTKYLNGGRFSNSDPQNNVHISVYASAPPSTAFVDALIGTDDGPGNLQIIQLQESLQFKSRDAGTNTPSSSSASLSGLIGCSRSSSSDYTFRARGGVIAGTFSSTSAAPGSQSVMVFQRGTSQPFPTDARLAFYSIGEALDLALLDARVTTLINAIAAAIPFNFLDPANLGQPVGGGYFGGLISHTADGNPTHALIVAPAATGATGTGYTLTTSLEWKTTNTSTAGTTSLFDGVANTAAMVAAGIANHPAAQFCTGLTIGGFNDWYLPTQLEHDIVYFNLKPTTTSNSTATGINAYAVPPRTANFTVGNPAQTTVTAFQTGGAEAFAAVNHWASNEASALNGRRFTYSSGVLGQVAKTTLHPVRAFRRIAL